MTLRPRPTTSAVALVACCVVRLSATNAEFARAHHGVALALYRDPATTAPWTCLSAGIIPTPHQGRIGQVPYVFHPRLRHGLGQVAFFSQLVLNYYYVFFFTKKKKYSMAPISTPTKSESRLRSPSPLHRERSDPAASSLFFDGSEDDDGDDDGDNDDGIGGTAEDPLSPLFDTFNIQDSIKSSVAGATLNFTNSIIGAGIIGLPYAFRQAGFFFGLVLLVALAFLVAWTVVLLVKCGKMVSKESYQDLIGAAFGGRGRFLIAFFQFIFAFGAMCAYIVIVGDTLPTVLVALLGVAGDPWYLSRTFIMILTTLCVSLPLSMQRDMAALAKTSAVSMVAIGFILCTVVVCAVTLPDTLRGDPAAQFTIIGDAPFKAIGVISFAFVCHHNTFIIFSSLSTPTLARFSRVTYFSAGISLVACLVLAITGYMTFTSSTQGNVLNNFPADSTAINFARLAFALNMFTTFPMELFVARHVAEGYFYPTRRDEPGVGFVPLVNGDTGDRPLPMPAESPWIRHAAWTAGLSLASLVVAVGVQDVSVVLEATGGVAASALAYILPPWVWLRVARSSRKSCVACMTFGIVTMVLSIVYR